MDSSTDSESGSIRYQADPHLWATVTVVLGSILLVAVIAHVRKMLKKNDQNRLNQICWKLKQMEQRLRLQEINHNLMEQICKKTNMAVDDEEGTKTRLNMIVNAMLQRDSEAVEAAAAAAAGDVSVPGTPKTTTGTGMSTT